MSKVFGYGEDALTLWTLKRHTSRILEHPKFQDKTAPSDCIVFYRPSFGRSGGKKSAEFGEFDAILVSSENAYLVESKWDNNAVYKKDEITLDKEQLLRHQILSWYLTHWNKKHYHNWQNFAKEQEKDFQKEFKNKKRIATKGLLAANLHFILTKSTKHCKKLSADNIKNVLLFFHNAAKKSKPPKKTNKSFTLIPIDYSKEIDGNFIPLRM